MNSVYNGTWHLEAFTIAHPEKGTRDWGTNLRGLLIYSSTGHVSVAINKDVKRDTTAGATASPTDTTAAAAPTDKDLLDSMLFYAGTFSVNGTVITHHVTIASNPARIGKEMIRFAALAGDVLTLTTPEDSYGTAKLVWRRIGDV